MTTETIVKKKCECGKEFDAKVLPGMPFAIPFFCEECQEKNDAEVREKECAENAARKKAYVERDIPVRFLDAKLSDFQIKDPLKSWLDVPDGFCFVNGTCGTGKSHLSCAITMNHRKKTGPCEIVFSSDLFLDLRASFNGRGSEDEIINRMTRRELFVFDDIGAQKMSEYAIEAWYTIIDKRYRNNIATLFTSNLSLKEISAFMTDRVASRLASGIRYELSGPDRRVKERK